MRLAVFGEVSDEGQDGNRTRSVSQKAGAKCPASSFNGSLKEFDVLGISGRHYFTRDFPFDLVFTVFKWLFPSFS